MVLCDVMKCSLAGIIQRNLLPPCAWCHIPQHHNLNTHHNEGITSHLYSYWHVAQIGEKRNAYRILVGKTEGKSPLGRPRYRWVGIIMACREIGWRGTDWIDLVQDRGQWRALVNTKINLRVP
jgi:hypothetical protein